MSDNERFVHVCIVHSAYSYSQRALCCSVLLQYQGYPSVQYPWYRWPYPLVPPRARPQNMHYWEMALVSDVTSIFVQLVINVCLLRVGSLSCFAVRNARFADLRYGRASETWHFSRHSLIAAAQCPLSSRSAMSSFCAIVRRLRVAFFISGTGSIRRTS